MKYHVPFTRFYTDLGQHSLRSYNGAEKSQLAFPLTIWAWFRNGARWKRSAWRLVWTQLCAVTFFEPLATTHLRSQNSKFECLSFKFLCSIQIFSVLKYNLFASICPNYHVFVMDLLPNEQNFDLDKSRQKFHHSLKEHHKISSIPKFTVLRTGNWYRFLKKGINFPCVIQNDWKTANRSQAAILYICILQVS